IRAFHVTGVQTCALPISPWLHRRARPAGPSPFLPCLLCPLDGRRRTTCGDARAGGATAGIGYHRPHRRTPRWLDSRPMNVSVLLALALASPMSPLPAGPSDPSAGATGAALTVQGDYVEARTCDVYTGACFANAEVNEAGKEATLAWKVRRGGVDGTSLEGLSVVAVVRANATLGDPYGDPLPSRSILLL